MNSSMPTADQIQRQIDWNLAGLRSIREQFSGMLYPGAVLSEITPEVQGVPDDLAGRHASHNRSIAILKGMLEEIKAAARDAAKFRELVANHGAKVQDARRLASEAGNQVATLQTRLSQLRIEYQSAAHETRDGNQRVADEKRREYNAGKKALEAAQQKAEEASQALKDLERQSTMAGGAAGLTAAERAMWEAVYSDFQEREAAGVKTSLLNAFAAYRRAHGAGATFSAFLNSYLGFYSAGGEITTAFNEEARKIGEQMEREIFDAISPVDRPLEAP